MRIVTWNVNGIRKRMPEVTKLVEETRPDVLCLQEIKATRDQIPESLTALPDYWSYWHGSSGGYSGVSLHLRRDRFANTPPFSHPSFDAETRVVEAPIEIAGAACRIASLYMPNGGKDYAAKIAFMKEVATYVAKVVGEGGDLVICGDLNVARADLDVHPSQRRLVIGQLPEERALFEAILAPGLVDVQRALDPANERLFTWWPYWRTAKARNLGWRLDYVLATKRIAALVRACGVHRLPIDSAKQPLGIPFGTSDHGALVADLAE